LQRIQYFIAEQLQERIINSSLEVVGRVGEVNSLHLVMSLVVVANHNKFCLGHDERLLNLFRSPLVLQLVTILTHQVKHWHVILFLLSPRSRPFFGLQYGGWFLQYHTLPFGWIISLFIDQTIGRQLTTYLRQAGIPTIQYKFRWLFLGAHVS
jgi:hypothetical protein